MALEARGWSTRVISELADDGHRLTGARRTLLDHILVSRQPFTAEELIEDLRLANVRVGRATVYRTLELLQSHEWLRLVHRRAPAGEHGYVIGEPGHRHHLVCTGCGTVIAFTGCDLASLLSDLGTRFGFHIEGHWMEAFGLCSNCRAVDSRTSTSTQT